MELPEIINKIDNIKASIDTAFETGKLDFDRMTGDLSAIGDALAERLKQEAKPESGKLTIRDKASMSESPNLKIEDYTL